MELEDQTDNNIEVEEEQNKCYTEEDDVYLSAQKPFLPYLCQQMKINSKVCKSETGELNSLYQPQWIVLMKKMWLPLTPFWTSMLRGEFYTNHTINLLFWYNR